MNKFNNPRLTNTTVSGTGVKHPMRPHVILGDPENGFIRGDLLDANAVIKLIKNAAKAIGALEELEQSNWIDDNDTTEKPTEETVGVLQPGEVGFDDDSGIRYVVYNDGGTIKPVAYTQGAQNICMIITDSRAFGKTLSEAYNAGYVGLDVGTAAEPYVLYATVLDKVIKNATIEGQIIDTEIPVS